jgi:pimeloyl-ACP methyl ester carboxylesterase
MVDDALGLLLLFLVAAALLVLLLTSMLVMLARRPPRHTAGYALANGMPCDPGDMDLPYESWMLDRPGGIALPVWDIEIPGASSSALTAVFVHGWGQAKVDMLPRLEPWREFCRRIVCYDLRGHGEGVRPHEPPGARRGGRPARTDPAGGR